MLKINKFQKEAFYTARVDRFSNEAYCFINENFNLDGVFISNIDLNQFIKSNIYFANFCKIKSKAYTMKLIILLYYIMIEYGINEADKVKCSISSCKMSKRKLIDATISQYLD